MALIGKLAMLAKSPQGRRLLAQAGKAARDPQNRERLEKVRDKIQNRGAAAPKSAAPESTATAVPEPPVPGQSGSDSPRATEPRP